MYELGDEFVRKIDDAKIDFTIVGEVQEDSDEYLIATNDYGENFVFLKIYNEKDDLTSETIPKDENELILVEDDEEKNDIIKLWQSEYTPEFETDNLWDND